jgi:carboxylesterase
MNDTLSRINQVIWEIREKIREYPDSLELRRDLLESFYESQLFMEKRNGIPRENRSFLLLQERESLCCLLIHGAGGSPEEMRMLGERLFKLGYTIYGLRLPLYESSSDQYKLGSVQRAFGRHARKGKGEQDGTGCTWSSCLSVAEVILDTLLSYTTHIYIIGFSFGATIAVNLLQKYPVSGLVLISPAIFAVPTARHMTFQLLRKVLPAVARSVAPREYTVLELMERTRARLQQIQQPVLVVHAADDTIVSSKGVAFLKNLSTNPKSQFLILESGGHVLVKGEGFERLFKLCSDFIKEV